MKANELMIGDWVQIVEPCKYAGAIGRVKTLIDHKDDENAYFKVFLKKNTIHICIEDICSDDIRPITLTPEILEKNGFVKGSYVGGFYSNWCPFRIYIAEGVGFSVFFDDEIHFTCTYIHQLQHALRLCEIDKTIEL